MAAFRYEVSFRVTHPTRTADEIADGLGMTPRHSWNVGARRVTPKGKVLEGVRDRSYCTFPMSEGDNGQIAKAIEAALDQLQKKGQDLRDLRESGGRFDFFIYWEADGMAGETFRPDLLSKLGELGIELQLDIYGPHCGPEDAWDCKQPTTR